MVQVSRGWRLTAWCIYLAIAFGLTHTPPGEINDLPDYLSDYILHGIGYAILGVLSVWVVSTNRRGITSRVLMIVYLAILIYAILDERTQPWVGRSCELTDWLADAAGAFVGMAAAVIVQRSWAVRQAST